MKITSTLRRLGVEPGLLGDDQRETLDRDGFLPLEGILTPGDVEAFRTRLAELVAEERPLVGSQVDQEAGAERLFDLVNKDPMFEVCFTHPVLLAAIAHVLDDDLKLSSLNARAALPGEGAQGLHSDWGSAVQGGEFQVCNSIWLLDDFTPENGATRVVRGSHRFGRLPSAEEAAPDGRHPDEELLIAPAGTVVVFNSHLWHGGTLNRTDRPRRAMHSYFSRRANAAQLDQGKFLRVRTAERLSPEARVVLDA